MNKELKSTRVERFLDEKQASWKIITNFWTGHLGDLFYFFFLLSRNYESGEIR